MHVCGWVLNFCMMWMLGSVLIGLKDRKLLALSFFVSSERRFEDFRDVCHYVVVSSGVCVFGSLGRCACLFRLVSCWL